MPRAPRTPMPVYAGDDDSQREASSLGGGITIYTDDRLQSGFVRVGIDDPQYFAMSENGVIPVTRELAHGEVSPAPSPGRGARIRTDWMDDEARDIFYAHPPEEMVTIADVTDDTITVRRGGGTTRGTYDRTTTSLLGAINWFDVELDRPVRHDQEPAADHRHEWAVTAMHMDGGVRFDLGCAHCDAVHRNVHRDRMEQLIDSNTAPEIASPEPTARNERTIPRAIPGYDWNTVTGDVLPAAETEAIIGGHRFPTERWSEGGYERTLIRVEGFRPNGERVAAQRVITISPRIANDHEQREVFRQRLIAQLMDECERAGMLRDDRVRISDHPW